MTGSGGWPLNVFLTPEQPRSTAAPTSRRSRATACPPGAGAAGDRRGVARAPRGAAEPAASCCASGSRAARAHAVGEAPISEASSTGRRPMPARDSTRARRLRRRAEVPAGAGPRVPARPRRARDVARRRCAAMAPGGIHDQLGGGFSRYSVDASWPVPHFEKMLYDNALLARAYAARLAGDRRGACCWSPAGARSTGRSRDARPGGRLLQRAGRRLRGRRGPLLRLDGRRAAQLFSAATPTRRSRGSGVSEGGTSRPAPPEPGLNVLQGAARAGAGRAADPRAPARGARRTRAPGARRQVPDGLERTDGRGARRRGSGTRTSRATCAAAVACADFIDRELRGRDGRLLRICSRGQPRMPAFLEDYALLLEALIVLFEASCEERWFLQRRGARG